MHLTIPHMKTQVLQKIGKFTKLEHFKIPKQ